MEKLLAFVVEDDKNLALAFGQAVEEADYNVEIIHDGQVALDRLGEVVPAIIILDLHIPNVKGVDILNHIREDERLKDIRVIVATADNRMANELPGVADLVLLKPVGYKQLRNLADRLRPV